jgi:hypothetical protein
MAALRNFITAVLPDSIVSLCVLPHLVHVLWDGSVGAQQIAAAAIYKISSSMDVKRLMGEHGCVCWRRNRTRRARPRRRLSPLAVVFSGCVVAPPKYRVEAKPEKSIGEIAAGWKWAKTR